MKDKQYSDKLDATNAARGINAANENARSLLSDSLILFEKDKFARALALAVLAIEEAGKPSIIRAIVLEEDPKIIKREWLNYRRHTKKTPMWIMPELFTKGARKLFDFKAMFYSINEHTQLLENLKQLAVYTDAFADCHWSIPGDVINKEVTTEIIGVAKILCPDSKHVSTEKEMELWVKHLRPVWKKGTQEMKKALVNFYSEAEAIGIFEKGSSTGMANFVL